MGRESFVVVDQGSLHAVDFSTPPIHIIIPNRGAETWKGHIGRFSTVALWLISLFFLQPFFSRFFVLFWEMTKSAWTSPLFPSILRKHPTLLHTRKRIPHTYHMDTYIYTYRIATRTLLLSWECEVPCGYGNGKVRYPNCWGSLSLVN